MKNVLNETPPQDLKGRLRESVEFVLGADIEGKNILDIGCGYGWCELNFLTRGAKSIVGIELTSDSLKTAQSNVLDKRAKFQEGSALKLPFKDNEFDTVVSWEVIEHIPKSTEPKMLAEAHRVLKPGGVFYLSTPNAHLISKVLDPAWWLIGHRHYSESRLASLGESCGFKVTEVRKRGGIFTSLRSLNMYISKWVLRRQPVFQAFFDAKTENEMRNGAGLAGIYIKFTKQKRALS
jgi:SAM-dependent methyltransferase